MRYRYGNPHNEVHKKDMHCYDLILPQVKLKKYDDIGPQHAKIAQKLAEDIEHVVRDLAIYNRGNKQVNGYLNTSLRPDGLLYVCFHLYDFQCSKLCVHHRGIKFDSHEELTKLKMKEIILHIGEHSEYKLGILSQRDDIILRKMGFGSKDAPLRTFSRRLVGIVA